MYNTGFNTINIQTQIPKLSFYNSLKLGFQRNTIQTLGNRWYKKFEDHCNKENKKEKNPSRAIEKRKIKKTHTKN